jgi:aryl-alcohol dehydrogenase-like predicted oxidoreductase
MDWLVPFGSTGLTVSRLGLGTGEIGSEKMTDSDAGQLLNAALDAGVTLIDTARGYGLAEERIGKLVSNRRNEFVLSTKVGYSVDGYEDWTLEIIGAGIERALKLMKTDVLDIVHLHSCPLDTLKNSGVVEALVKAKEAGKIRVAAYSGENDELAWAVSSGQFGSVQTSVSIFDQASLNRTLPEAIAEGIGVIAKRPVANSAWRFAERPVGAYAEEYWARWKAMGLEPEDLDWQELALRYTAYAPGVSSAIVGTGNLAHFLANIEVVRKGPLPTDLVETIDAAYRGADQGWLGQI